MREILKGTKLYLKNLFRNKMMIMLCIIPIYDFLILKGCFDGINYKLIGVRAYLIQGIMLGMIYLGFILAKQEKKDSCNEVFLSINKWKEKSLISKLLVGVICSIGMTIYLIVGQLIVTYVVGHPLELLSEILLGYIIYALIPMIIFYIIGIIIGEKVRGYKAYGFIFFIWIMCTNLNSYVLRLLESYVYENLNLTTWGLTIGLFNPGYSMYNGVEGYAIYSFTVAKIILILALVMIFFINMNFNKRKSVYLINLFLAGILIYSGFNLYDNRYNIKEKSIKGDTWNLNEDTSMREGAETNNYEIKEYDIVMNAGNESNFNVSLNVEFKEVSGILNFTLDERAKINYIKDEEGNSLNFKRDGFLTSVNLEKKREKGYKEKIVVDYSMFITGKTIFANDYSMNLSKDYPYIPLETLGEVYSYKYGRGMDWNNLSKGAKYNVKVNNAENKLYSNLKEVGENEFSGYSNNGLYLLETNELIEEEYKGIKFYYSKISKGNIDIGTCHEQLKKVCQVYEDITGEKKDYKRVFLLGLNQQIKTFDMEDTLLLNALNSIDEGEVYYIMQRNLLYNQNYNKEIEYILLELMNPVIEFVYFDNESRLEELKYKQEIYSIDDTFNVVKQEKFQKIIVKILENNNIDKKEFVRKFYEVLKNKGGINEVENFLIGFERGKL